MASLPVIGSSAGWYRYRAPAENSRAMSVGSPDTHAATYRSSQS
jgi:hypothetical protein